MPSSYTEKEVEKLVDVYTTNPCIETVERLMTLLNRPKKSIISKLCKEGVYVTRSYRTKTGDIPVTKLALTRAIEDDLDLKLPGLDKAPKAILKALSTTIREQTSCFEDALGQLKELSEEHAVLTEMLQSTTSKKKLSYDPLDEL